MKLSFRRDGGTANFFLMPNVQLTFGSAVLLDAGDGHRSYLPHNFKLLVLNAMTHNDAIEFRSVCLNVTGKFVNGT
jgi:hypothetical protein